MLPQKSKPAGRLIPERKSNFRVAAALWVTAAFVVIGTLGASAENATANIGKAGIAPKDGALAKGVSPATTKDALLQGLITKAKGNTSAQVAKAAADRYEALQHGHPLPGTDQMQLIMNGYVPPGMPPQQAAMLYNSLPNNLKMPHGPQPGTPEWVSEMAGATAGLPQGLNRGEVQAANQKMFEGYMRERFGPVYVPPLHRDHNHAPDGLKTETHGMVKQDHQMSLIPARFSFDGNNAPKSIREMTDSSGVIQSQFGYDPYGRQTQISGSGAVPDFGYAGMYVHQRSGLNLTPHRAYSPSMGRWLSRDPVQDPTFSMSPRSPGPRDPKPGRIAARLKGPAAQMQLLAQVPHLTANRPVELNPYAYVANDPIRWSDPNGTAIGGGGGGGILCKLFPWLPGCQPQCPSNGNGGGCHPPKGLPEWTRADCYLWCRQNCDQDDFQSCCDECDEHYDD
jgi:RHS repeat-associated protein